MKWRVVPIALLLMVALTPTGLAHAEKAPPPPVAPDGLPPGARVVAAGNLDTCEPVKDPNAPCTYVVYEVGPSSGAVLAPDGVTGTSTYQCGVWIENWLHVHVATLTNNTTAELRTQSPRWRLASGYNSYWAGTGYSWTSKYGPKANQPWNTWVSTAWTYSEAKLMYLGAIYKWYHASNYFNSNGTTSCNGGEGQVFPRP